MRIPIHDLSGVKLDWAVAASMNLIEFEWPWYYEKGVILTPDTSGLIHEIWSPTKNWNQAGPIIDREVSSLAVDGGRCVAVCSGYEAIGPTLLVAAMRAVVASYLGTVVCIPNEVV